MRNILDAVRAKQILANFKQVVPFVSFEKGIDCDDLLEKAINRGNLTLKQITDKNGKQTKRWVDPNDKEHMEHGTHASFEHNGEKKTGKVGRVSSSGRYVVHGDDGTIYKKHPMELQKHDGDKAKDVSNDSKNKGLPKGAIGKTNSGKYIYNDAEHPEHKDFSKEDHEDAVKLHSDKISEKQKIVDETGGYGSGMLANHEKRHHTEQKLKHSKEATKNTSATKPTASKPTKPIDAKKVKQLADNKANLDKALSKEKELLSGFKRNGYTKDHKMFAEIKKGFARFKELSQATLKKYGKDVGIHFDVEVDNKKLQYEMSIMFDKYDLQEKHKDKFSKNNAGLASSSINNNSADVSAEMLNSIMSRDGGYKFSSSGYSYSGSWVGFPVVSGSFSQWDAKVYQFHSKLK